MAGSEGRFLDGLCQEYTLCAHDEHIDDVARARVGVGDE